MRKYLLTLLLALVMLPASVSAQNLSTLYKAALALQGIAHE